MKLNETPPGKSLRGSQSSADSPEKPQPPGKPTMTSEMKTARAEYEEWLKIRSPRRVLIEELNEKFHEAKRELWSMCPCPKCRGEEHRNLQIVQLRRLLPGKFFNGETVEVCDKCEGRGFFIDWEQEL